MRFLALVISIFLVGGLTSAIGSGTPGTFEMASGGPVTGNLILYPDENGIVKLPEGAELGSVSIEQDNLLLEHPDGSTILVVGAAQASGLLIGGSEVVLPMAVIFEALAASDLELIETAAGPADGYWQDSLMDWPPPRASARAVIDPRGLAQTPGGLQTLGNVDRVLTRALSDAGYEGPGYLGVPGGYAIVTRLEQTDAQGIPLKEEARWSAEIGLIRPFSIGEYLRALFTAPNGHFRIVALVVSDQPFATDSDVGTLDEMQQWSDAGLNVLPPAVEAMSYTDAHRVTALIYEFEKSSESEEPVVNLPGRLPASRHLSHTDFAQVMR